MCKHGDTVPVKVKVLADQAFEGVDTWKVKQIDRCIASVVQALQDDGIDMRSSCCGHGETKASIVLASGSVVEFIPPDQHLENVLQSILNQAGYIGPHVVAATCFGIATFCFVWLVLRGL